MAENSEPASAGRLSIEVIWIGVEPPWRMAVEVDGGTTVEQALALSGVASLIHDQSIGASADEAGLPWVDDSIGVACFGRRVALTDPLHDGDRIELLPRVIVDPKIARQRRADHRRRLVGERRWTPDRAVQA
jgi:putative ubiquitin-RnfH superfamily antitoxin RatB of RatAB toxin-antitoxin module